MCTLGVNNFFEAVAGRFCARAERFRDEAPSVWGPDPQLPKVERTYSQEEIIDLRKKSMRIMIIMEEMTPSTWMKPEKNLKRLN